MFVWNFNYSIEALRQAQRDISNTKLFGARCARAFFRVLIHFYAVFNLYFRCHKSEFSVGFRC